MVPAPNIPRLLLSAAACGVALAPARVLAYSWEYTPIVSVGAIYETNPFYFSDSNLIDDGYGGFLDATVAISGETGRSQLSFRPRTRITVYTGADNASDLNSADYYLPLYASWRSQRTQYSLNGGYSRVSTRNSEVRITDPNDSGQTGSSGRIVSVDEDQERGYLYPTVAFQLSQRDLLQLSFSLDDVTYTKAEVTQRSNYIYGDTSFSWTRTLGPKSRVTGSVNVNGFNADRPGSPVENKTISYGADAGYEYMWSDLTTVGLTLGSSRSDIDVTGLATVDDANGNPIPCRDPDTGELVLCELKANEKNFVGRAFVQQKTSETITTEFSVSRSLQPNSDGAQVTQDSINAFLDKQFSPTLSGKLGAIYVRQKAVGADVAGSAANRFDRDYTRLNASLSWQLTRTWYLVTLYGYTHDEQKSGATYTTDNHSVSVELRYAALGKH